VMTDPVLVPLERMKERLLEIRSNFFRALDQIAGEPFEQDWPRRSDELSQLFAEAVESRHHLETASIGGAPPLTFLNRFEALERWHLDLSHLDRPGLTEVRRLLVHELRNDIAVLHLLVDQAEGQEDRNSAAPAIQSAIARIRAFAAIALNEEEDARAPAAPSPPAPAVRTGQDAD